MKVQCDEMRIKLGKETPEFQLFMDFWNMMQEVWGIENTAEYRNHATDIMNNFLIKHDSPMAYDLNRCLLDELNRRKAEMENEQQP